MGDSVIYASHVFAFSYNLVYFPVSTVLNVSDTTKVQYSHLPPPKKKQPHEGKHAPLKFHFLSFALFAGQVSYLLILTSFERLLPHFASISVCFLYRSLHQDKSVPGNERALAILTNLL